MHFRLLLILAGLNLSACTGGASDQRFFASTKQPERSSVAKPESPLDQRVSAIISRLTAVANPDCTTSKQTTAHVDTRSTLNEESRSVGVSSENFGPRTANEIETDVPVRAMQGVHEAAAIKCGEYPVVITSAMNTSASTNGQRIRISRGFVQFTRDDSELAFVLAHEMAHILKHHLPVRETGVRHTQELEADQLGFQLVIRAGYDPDSAIELFRRLGGSSDFATSDPTYPTFTARADILQREKALLTLEPPDLSRQPLAP